MSPRAIVVFASFVLMLWSHRADAQRLWPAEVPPRPLAAREVKFPPYEIRTLPNGLQVVAVVHHEQPVVSIRLIVRAGSALDPRDKLGLAHLAASLLDQGTASQSAQQISDSIDFIGGAMGAGAGPDLTFVNLVVMKDSFDVGLRMLSDVARRPAFAQEEIERQRQQTVSSLSVSFEDPEFVANAVFNRLVYGFHPYAMPDSGTPETLAAITRNDLVAYHRQQFVPNNAILAIVGDVTADEAFAGVTKILGDWERRDVPPRTFTPPPDPTRRIVVVNKRDAVQTEVRVGHLGIRRNHEDYMPLNLAIRILGGEGANRLHQVLRTDRGLTYGAQADMDTFKDSGDFEAQTNTRNEATGEVVRLVLDQFYRLTRDRVGSRELSDAKAYLSGSFPLTIEVPDAIATQVLNVLFFGLPVEELQSFRDRVNAITVADIERVARAYLKPDRVAIVLVGRASVIAPQLKSLNLVPFETIEIENLDLTAADLKRAGRAGAAGGAGTWRPALAGPADPAGRAARSTEGLAYQRSQGVQTPVPAPTEGLTTRALLEKVIMAKGGLETLRGIKSIRAVTMAPMVKAEITTYLEYPNKMRVESKLPTGSRIEVFDGKRGWVREGTQIHDVPAEAIRSLELTFKRDTIAMLLAAVENRLTARRLPDVKDASGDVHHALEFASADLDPVVLYVEPKTYLIAKQVYIALAPGKPLVEEIFSDYKPVSGIMIAFTARVRTGGQQVYERRVSQIEINPAINAQLFARPGT
jgi:zinc protease